MHRRGIINHLGDKIDAQTYLEIGVGPHPFNPERNHKFPFMIGVDPNGKGTHNMTSDEFFQGNKDSFDLIFVDGLHHAEQVERDINNSLGVLNDGGFIICHDMSPPNELAQRVPSESQSWTGDCWKAWVRIRSTNSNLSMFVVDTDYGCGVICRGRQELLDLKGSELTYENLDKNRKKWLNLVSQKEFLEMDL